jgi:hypothetical protein
MFNHLKTFTKPTSTLTLKELNVIFQFESLKRTTHKVHMNNTPSKNFKNICFWDKEIEKQTKIATHRDL